MCAARGRSAGHPIAHESPARALAGGLARRPLPLPKDVRFVTFDCYGTLIDWETGAYEAYRKEAEREGFTVDRNALIPLFHEIQIDIQSGSYELYA